MNDIVDVLKGIRSHTGLTQKEFSKRLSMKQSAYSMIESGVNKASIDLLKSIIDIFNVSPDVFFGDYDINIINDILNTNNVKVNVKDDVKVDAKKEVQKEFLQHNGASDAELRLLEVNALKHAPYQTEAVKKLGDIEAKYNKKVRFELLKENKELAELLRLVDQTDILISDIYQVYFDHIFITPNLFDSINYADFKALSDKTNIPDKVIDYKDYKQKIIQWLESIKTYQAAIQDFHKHGEQFLNKIEPAE